MKTRMTLLAIITLALPLALFIACNALGQAPGEPKALTYTAYTDTFHFSGGTPRQFLEAIENHYNKDFKIAWLAGASKLKDEPPETLKALEKELNDFKVDWLSIAEIPAEMDHVRVPAIRTSRTRNFPVDPATLRPGIALRYYEESLQEQLKHWVMMYNHLGRAKPELGQLVVDGDMAKPIVVMLAPDKASATPQPEVKFKAFALRTIREKDWPKLLKDIERAEEEARKYTRNLGGRAPQKGTVSIHQDTGLLVAHGPQTFVDMVGSVMTAYLENQEREAEGSPPKN